MRTDTPRLAPLKDEELDAEQEEIFSRFRNGGADHAIGRTFMRHPKLWRAYNAFASHTFSADNTLSKRESEIITMRTVWQAKAGYQWSRHVPMAMHAGLKETEVDALKKSVELGKWSDSETALIEMVDALTADPFVPDDVWEKLTAHFNEQQCLDAIFLCGRYVMAAMFTNSVGTPIDADVVLDPDLDARNKR
mgnify:CR=1 FL=1